MLLYISYEIVIWLYLLEEVSVLLQFKKYYVMIPFIVIIFALSACTKKEAVVVVNNSVKADNDDKVVENKSVDSGLYTEKLSTLANHRIMAIDRAEKEKVITVSISFDEEKVSP